MQRTLRARLRSEPLWDFALRLYACTGVEAACLQLQDEAGVDICELLWHCWLYRHGVGNALAPSQLEAVRRWQHEVTAPLRCLRRELKSTATRRQGVAKLRRTLKQAELLAEHEALSRLEQLTFNATLTRLPTPHPAPTRYLSEALKLQQKPHLQALHSLDGFLDPS